MSTSYLKAGPIAGQLIRTVIQLLKGNDFSLPIHSHILIALSGGSDSVALAHLLTYYGRRIISRDQIHLLHVNHGWRGEASNADEMFVRELAGKWQLPLIVATMPKDSSARGSPEEKARAFRKKVFREERKKLGESALVLTGHQADDLAETVIWRLMTGGSQSHGGGIAVFKDGELRPFLKIRKKLLQAYLSEVGQSFREDQTNFEGKLLRSQLRMNVMPLLETIFPKAVHHLVEQAIFAQNQNRLETRPDEVSPSYELFSLLQSKGLKVRRFHLQFMLDKEQSQSGKEGSMDLPGGWRVSFSKRPSEKWILEKR